MAGGSIPACAGETTRQRPDTTFARVYPRLCGGNYGRRFVELGSTGLSPLVRGKPSNGVSDLIQIGSIPACAGETLYFLSVKMHQWVYPRLCGGNTTIHPKESGLLGLSPLVRGKHLITSAQSLIEGSIPACAGETLTDCPRQSGIGVYPRLCGGNRPNPMPVLGMMGLSPLVRGKHHLDTTRTRVRGSIPACAGETCGIAVLTADMGVYPRLCGGNYQHLKRLVMSMGLSPLVRGKHAPSWPGLNVSGSIPACAGETHPATSRSPFLGVYPRLCGGNSAAVNTGGLGAGLSPLVRGKLSCSKILGLPPGSIPACAGETWWMMEWIRPSRVYPRLCGGNSCIQHYDLLKKNGFSILIC